MLILDKVSVSYSNKQVLHEVTVNVEETEAVSIIGSNGAGKTTLLKAIYGLVESKKGKITLGKTEITTLPTKEIVKKGISLVPEERQLFNMMTVEENLILGAYVRLKGGQSQGVRDDFESVYGLFPVLQEKRKLLAGTMSGGEQQMLSIARALMVRPRVLLLDEPSMGLAPLLVKEIYSVLRKLNREGTTMLLVEQNAFMAMNFSGRTYVLSSGSITMQGRSSVLMEDDEIRKVYLGCK